MVAIPEKIINIIDFIDRIPMLKDGATDEQKIIYADFMKEYLANNNKDDLDNFLNITKVKNKYILYS